MKKRDFDKFKAELRRLGFNESFDKTLELGIRQQAPLKGTPNKQGKKRKKGKCRTP